MAHCWNALYHVRILLAAQVLAVASDVHRISSKLPVAASNASVSIDRFAMAEMLVTRPNRAQAAFGDQVFETVHPDRILWPPRRGPTMGVAQNGAAVFHSDLASVYQMVFLLGHGTSSCRRTSWDRKNTRAANAYPVLPKGSKIPGRGRQSGSGAAPRVADLARSRAPLTLTNRLVFPPFCPNSKKDAF